MFIEHLLQDTLLKAGDTTVKKTAYRVRFHMEFVNWSMYYRLKLSALLAKFNS